MDTPETVALWMFEALKVHRYLDQEYAVWEIKKRFGDEFTFINDNGNLSINKKVLTAFRKLTGDSVVWERGEKCWRRREGYDAPGRQQD